MIGARLVMGELEPVLDFLLGQDAAEFHQGRRLPLHESNVTRLCILNHSVRRHLRVCHNRKVGLLLRSNDRAVEDRRVERCEVERDEVGGGRGSGIRKGAKNGRRRALAPAAVNIVVRHCEEDAVDEEIEGKVLQ